MSRTFRLTAAGGDFVLAEIMNGDNREAAISLSRDDLIRLSTQIADIDSIEEKHPEPPWDTNGDLRK